MEKSRIERENMDNRSNNLYNEINMKNILSLISISSLLLVLAACGTKQAPTAEEIVAKARAVKDFECLRRDELCGVRNERTTRVTANLDRPFYQR